MRSVKSDLSFGGYVEVVEVINPNTTPGQFNIRVIMNSRGTRFQASIGKVELQGIHKPYSNMDWGPGNYTVRELILLQKKYGGKKLFLLVTKKWLSDAWQDNFLLKS